MARAKFRSRDRNRFVKRYQFVKAARRNTYIADNDVVIELGRVKFVNEAEKLFTFEQPFDSNNYAVTVIPRDTSTTDSAHVNIFIDNDRSGVTGVMIVASAPFTGEVDIMAIRVGA